MSQSSHSGRWAEHHTALVTGATSGFGLALSERLLSAGARVIATGRRQDRLQVLAERFGFDRVFPAVMDVADPQSVTRVFEALPPAFADIDVLFNNAGLALGLEPAQSARLADWDTMIDTNIRGLVYVTRQVLPGMVARNRGMIVNMSSVAASYPYPGGNVYGASKAFVRQFSLNLRADLLGTLVRVTSVEPGMCQTEFADVRFRGDAAAAERVYEGMLPLSAGDVADVIISVMRLPAHVNINSIEVMPIQQAFGAFSVHRNV